MSTTDRTHVTTALAVVDAFDTAADRGERGLPAAMAAVPGLAESEVKDLLVEGARLKEARDYGLDQVAQMALDVSLADVRADRPAAYQRLREMDEGSLARWFREASAGGETTPGALRALLDHLA